MRSLFNKHLTDESQPLYNKVIKWLWRFVFGGILAVILLFVALSFTDLPSVEELKNPQSEEASQVFSLKKKVLGRFYTKNRVIVDYSELSPNLVRALVATEDERFYRHSGIDFYGLARAVAYLGKRGGASTITQQLARQLFTGPRAKNTVEALFQKLKEWIIAVRLERGYTKEEIIALYLNKFSFINGAYGIKAASEIYFGKGQDELSLTEAAMLVGMLQNPSLYNPLRFEKKALKRREVVLYQMKKNNLLDETAYDSLRQLPLGLNYTRQSHIDGLAPYFRSELAKELKKILAKPEKFKAGGVPYDIYKDGLKIYTSIDYDLQRIAEEEMIKNMKKVQKTFFRRWRKMDPWTYKGESEHEISVEKRAESLAKLIRTSDRYQDLRTKYIADVVASLEKETDLRFHTDDREIVRILKEDEKKGYLSKLVSRKMISSNLAVKYRAVLRSKNFTKLKTQWDVLQEKVDDVFSKPVEMKVFAYNDKMESDTTMSPLDSVRYHRMFMQTGIIAVDPHTGFVKVWIGGINHKYFKYDHTRISRQVGSTFKPFVYSTAIAIQNFSPCYEVLDLPVTIKPGDGKFYLNKEWTPKNANGQYSGNVFTLKEGLRKSKNTVSVHLMKELGSSEPVRDLVDLMGISKTEKYANGTYRVPKAPSICLGAADLSVMEMAGAYTTFANEGVYTKPVFILRIEDKTGKEIYHYVHKNRSALNSKPNYVMLEMLKYAGGLGYQVKSETAGKTGTTNDFVDGWFMGVTPDLVVGTWVGGEDKWIRFRSIVNGQGGVMAKPFFRSFIKRLEAEEENIDYSSKVRFKRPVGPLGIELDCGEYQGSSPLDGDDSFEDEGEFEGEDMFGDEFEDEEEEGIK